MIQQAKGIVHAMPCGVDDANTPVYTYIMFGADMTTCGYIPVAEVTVEFDPGTPHEILAKHVKILRDKIEQVYADAEKTAASLRAEVNNLLALTYEQPTDQPKELNDAG